MVVVVFVFVCIPPRHPPNLKYMGLGTLLKIENEYISKYTMDSDNITKWVEYINGLSKHNHVINVDKMIDRIVEYLGQNNTPHSSDSEQTDDQGIPDITDWIKQHNDTIETIENYLASITQYDYHYQHFAGSSKFKRHELSLRTIDFFEVMEHCRDQLSSDYLGFLQLIKDTHQGMICSKINEASENIYEFSLDAANYALNYSLQVNSERVETLPHILMRFCLNTFNPIEKARIEGLTPPSNVEPKCIHDIIECFDYLCHRKFIVPAPAIAYSGTIHEKGTTCFTYSRELNSTENLLITGKELSDLYFGGAGIHVHEMPVDKILKYTKILSDMTTINGDGHFRIPQQSFYIEPWHAGIFAILELKNPMGSEVTTLRDCHIGLSVPDEFMRCVELDLDWYLFDPSNCQVNLADYYGTEFVTRYHNCIADPKCQGRKIRARELWQKILSIQIKSGEPYLIFKDAINRKSNENHFGKKIIRGSNLCCEVVQYADNEYTAACNVMTMSAPAFLINSGDGGNYQIDWDEFVKVAKFLHRVADHLASKINILPSKYARKSAELRALGIGLNGVTDVIFKYDMSYSSKEAIALNQKLYEHLQYGLLLGSVELAQESGSYSQWNGSPSSKGKFQSDLWDDELRIKANQQKIVESLHLNELVKTGDSSLMWEQLSGLPIKFHRVDQSEITRLMGLIWPPPPQSEQYHSDQITQDVCVSKIIAIISTRINTLYHLQHKSVGNNQHISRTNWDQLRKDMINNGLRNSQLSAQPPSVGGSVYLDTIPSAEPITSNLFITKTSTGSNWNINKHLYADFQKYGVDWELVVQDLIKYKGSIQSIDQVKCLNGSQLDDSILNKLKQKYKTVWEMMEKDHEIIYQHSSARARYIDQSESLNIFIGNPTVDYLTKCHFTAWRYGLKTGMYYLKMSAAREAVQFTINVEPKNNLSIVTTKYGLFDDPRKYTLLPIIHQGVWDIYKIMEDSTWKAGEIDCSRDLVEFRKLDTETQTVIKKILTFFAVSDGLVGELLQDFTKDIKMKEAIKVYISQCLQESVHEEVYNKLIQVLISDPNECTQLFSEWEQNKTIKQKIIWGLVLSSNNIPEKLDTQERKFYDRLSKLKEKYHQSECQGISSPEANFTIKLLANACMEGIMFSSSFAFIFYLSNVRKLNNMVGLIGSNEFISRDEGLHRDFAIYLYNNYITHKVSEEFIRELVSTAVEIEIDFINDVLPNGGLPGLGTRNMENYVKLVADNLVVSLGYRKIYEVNNPFEWMDMIGIEFKTDQFHKRVTNYRSNVSISFNDTQQSVTGCNNSLECTSCVV